MFLSFSPSSFFTCVKTSCSPKEEDGHQTQDSSKVSLCTHSLLLLSHCCCSVFLSVFPPVLWGPTPSLSRLPFSPLVTSTMLSPLEDLESGGIVVILTLH